ncbi:MAG: hypothetical protein M1827_003257 [Pycnora praestabilis]|nr:MAG: hypothetical protein M1827_003257 [Pycnora praestabilis]
MKTVSTLCATSTVGAAAAGYSFGSSYRPTSSRPTTNKRKASADVDLAEGNYSSYAPSPGRFYAATPASPYSLASESPKASGPNEGGLNIGRGRRRKSADILRSTSSPVPYHDEYSAVDKESSTLDRKTSVRSRSSWLRRFSTLSTSHNVSRTSSPLPDSPSLDYSNKSTAPTIPSAAGWTPSTPNKLVKRKSSQNLLGASSDQLSGSKSQVPTLRRPATSHQRSATLQQQFLLDGGSYQGRSSHQVIETPQHWRMYFQPRPTRPLHEGKLSRKRSIVNLSRAPDTIIRRIYPDEDHQPTLLMAASINTPNTDHEGYMEHDESSIFFGGSRPATPSALSTFLSSPPEEAMRQEPADSSRRPRHSFSISDILSSSSPSLWKMPRSQSVRSKHIRNIQPTGRRISSAPLSSASNQPLASEHTNTTRPPKRREVTDPTVVQKRISASHLQDLTTDAPPNNSTPDNISSPIPSLGTYDQNVCDTSSPAPSHRHFSVSPSQSYVHSPPPSSPPTIPMFRPHRLSVAPSDRASTLVGSDNETRGFVSGDEDEMDLRSETVFDSLRTGTTGSISGARGPRIDKVFDEPPPVQQTDNVKLVSLQDLIPNGTFKDTDVDIDWRDCIAEEDESMSTPVRADVRRREDALSTPIRARGHIPLQQVFSSSPPDAPQPLNLGKLEWDTQDSERGLGQWSFSARNYEVEDVDWDRNEEDLPVPHDLSSPKATQQRASPLPKEAFSNFSDGSPRLPAIDIVDRDARSNLFDWSEQHFVEKSSLKGSSPRPRTVHGKQMLDGRGSRSSGRRKPSALHVRSQSVPVVPDSASKRDHNNATNKYGTWGLGSKGPSEDWNEDFDFDGAGFQGNDGEEDRHIDKGILMIVPQAIRERQASVIGHLSHVREFALLVEDLKRLRTLAMSKNLIEGASADLWKEADGIINLATLDDEDDELPPPCSPSSPSFNFDAFEEELAPPSITSRSRRRSLLSHESGTSPNGETGSITGQPSMQQHKTPTPSPARPRKDSSAVAKSLIETIHQQRSTSDPLLNTTNSRSHNKMPFDTTTLRDLVIHVGGLKRTLAEIVRTSDDSSNPDQRFESTSDPSANLILAESLGSSPSLGKGHLPRKKSSNANLSGTLQGKENELSGHTKMMAVA